MSGLRIATIQLLCLDRAAAAAFYTAAFGPEFDRMCIELVATSATPGAPAPSNATSFQHCAIIVSDMDAAMARLRAVPGWTAISRAGPERLPATSGGVTAFKFRDPDGHPLEFLQFPPDAVPPAWRSIGGLFLGIDHTAITVADTDRSIAFYATLGFMVSSRGLNRGIEQARMDDVDAPVVEVIGLTPPGGAPPHLELLSYRDPGTLSRTTASDDVLATRMIFEDRADTDAARLWSPPHSFDPDGHRFTIRRS